MPKKKPAPRKRSKPPGNPIEENDKRHFPQSDGWGTIRDKNPWGPGAPGWPGKR